MVRPRGKAHGVLGRCKRMFCRGQGPDTGDLDVWPWARRRGPWRLGQTPRIVAFGPGAEWDSCLSGKPDFEEAFSPSFDPRAQHINRGAGLAPKTHQETPSRVPETPSPLVYPPS